MTIKRTFFISLLMLLPLLAAHAAGDTEKEHPWKGRWITTDRAQGTPNTWLIYRKEAKLDKVPEVFNARIAADSKYWMWINDSLVVFEGGLKRGPAPGQTYYDVVDIAPYLVPGDNTIAILLWYFGKNGFSHASSGATALLFDAQSPEAEIVSDNTWLCGIYEAFSNTGAPHPNYRLPESNIRFDARKALDGWNKKGYKGRMGRALATAFAGDEPFGKLVERPIPLWKDYGMAHYVSMEKSGDTLKCRLPYNCHVTPYIKLEAAAGDTVRIQTDNYNGGSELNVRAEYITRDGVQEYENPGWMNGHQVWYIVPENVKVLGVKFRETGYDAEFAGSFSCDDPFMNELWKRSARTLYVTMRDTYMDCPDRERAQWWGDAVNELGETFYALSPSGQKLAVKGIRELMNWQRADGTIYSPVPSGNWSTELPLQMLASVGWYGFYTQYYYSGDSSFVADIYAPMHRYLHQVWKTDEKGLAVLRQGEWNWGDWGWDIDMGVLTNCWYYLALKAEREFALQLGKADDARMIDGMMRRIEENFDKEFWNGRVYRSKGYTGADDDRAQAMAVVSGLASKDKYPALAESLKKEYHASPYMEKYVLEALFMMGEDKFALKRIHDRYEKMMNYKDYTTLFEGWGIGAEGFGGGTINHAWSGGPLTMLSQKVCGIEPTSPGFKTFRVAPQMGGLKNASAKLVTADGGEITVEVKVSGKKMEISVTVPQDTEAKVVFPDGKTKQAGAGTHVFRGSAVK